MGWCRRPGPRSRRRRPGGRSGPSVNPDGVADDPGVALRQTTDRSQERPLVLPRLHRGRVEKDGRARLAALSLQRQSDQVPESLLWDEILGREQPVIAAQVYLGPYCHRLPQQSCTEPSGRGSRYRLFEEDPHVRPVTRAGTLQHRRHPHLSTHPKKGKSIQGPAALVEITSQEPALVPVDERVHARRDPSGQMRADDLVIEGKVPTRGGPSGLGRRPARLPVRRVHPTQRVNVAPPSKQRPVQSDLLPRRRTPIHPRLDLFSGREQCGRPLRSMRHHRPRPLLDRSQPFVLRCQTGVLLPDRGQLRPQTIHLGQPQIVRRRYHPGHTSHR